MIGNTLGNDTKNYYQAIENRCQKIIITSGKLSELFKEWALGKSLGLLRKLWVPAHPPVFTNSICLHTFPLLVSVPFQS